MLLGEEPAVGAHDHGSGVMTRFRPTGVRAETVGQNGHVDLGEIGGELRIGETRVHADVDTGPTEGLESFCRPRDCETLVIQVEPQDGVRSLTGEEGLENRPRLNVGPQALSVHPDDGYLALLPWCADDVDRQHVRMRQDDGVAAPPFPDDGGGALGQRDDRGRGRHQDVQVRQMLHGVGEVRVVQIVHGQHQRHALTLQRGHDVGQLLEGERLEAEVDVQDVERAFARGEIVGVEVAGRPPLPRQGGTGRNGIGQQPHPHRIHHGIHVGMPGWHGGHGQHIGPFVGGYFSGLTRSTLQYSPGSVIGVHETPGRTRHYADFYGVDFHGSDARVDDGTPLWVIVGNCQAEALRQVLEGAGDGAGPTSRPHVTVRMPPVHELERSDLPALHRLLRRASVLLSQPIRTGYRGLPLGTDEMAAELPRSAQVLRWPVIRYAGLHPFQAIVRNPADRSVVPPVVPYHDLRTVIAARDGRSDDDEWDVPVTPAAFLAVADASCAELARRERAQCDVGVSDVLRQYGVEAAHTINHPGNRVLTELGRRVLRALDVDLPVSEPVKTLLDSAVAPLDRRVLKALDLDAPERRLWTMNGVELEPTEVHRAQLQWYRDNPEFVSLALTRHRATLDLLGLGSTPAA